MFERRQTRTSVYAYMYFLHVNALKYAPIYSYITLVFKCVYLYIVRVEFFDI